MKKSTLEKMHDASIECGLRLNWARAIARIVARAGELPDCPQWAVGESIEAIDHLIGEAKDNLISIGLELEKELYK